jgi:uncharacterized membrane protein YGL010W
MTTVEQHFAAYQAYHLNPRNKATHYLGIPLIVYAILNLLSCVAVPGQPFLNLATVLFVVVSIFYLSLDIRLALGMGLLTLPVYVLAMYTPWWAGLTTFVVGWILQLIGHQIEGKKPAFLTNFLHLFIGPLWIASHLMEKLGLWRPRPVEAVHSGTAA